MTTKYEYQIHHQDLATGPLQLEARAKRGFEIYEIGIADKVDHVVPAVFIGEEIMLGIPSFAGNEEVAPVRDASASDKHLFAMLLKAFPEVPTLKICEGEMLQIENYDEAGEAYIHYKELRAEDIPVTTDPGASESKIRLVISHGQYLANVAAATTVDVDINVSLNPPGLTRFPWEARVPMTKNFEFLGFCIAEGECMHTDISLDFLRMWRQSEAFLGLAEEWLNPALFPYPVNTVQTPIHLFNEKYIFVPNDRHQVQIRLTNVNVAEQEAHVYCTCFYRSVELP